MERLALTVDLGNSRCKPCLWDLERRGAPRAATAFPADVGLAARLSDWLEETEEPALAALCSVAAPAVEEAVARCVERALPEAVRLQVAPPHGLALDVEHPETVGADRLYAARGACELLGRTCLVVDAGTALTVDLVRVEGGRASFAGGAIAPGPVLLARALAQGGARLVAVDPDPRAPALGRHTRAALAAGIGVGFRGAARELVGAVAREAGLSRPPVVLTGGAVPFLTAAEPLADDVREDPWLVQRGLLAAALDAVEGPRR